MTHRRIAYIWALISVLLVVTLTMLIGTAFSRYRVSNYAALNMSTSYSSNGIWLWSSYNDEYSEENAENEDSPDKYLDLQGWTSTDGSNYTLDFLLTNEGNDQRPADFSQNATIDIFVSEGIGVASNLTVTLTTGSETYTAAAAEAVEGSTAYSAYGAGWIYKFVNKNGQPVTWLLKGQSASTIPMTLTVTGEGVEPASISLIATGMPAD